MEGLPLDSQEAPHQQVGCFIFREPPPARAGWWGAGYFSPMLGWPEVPGKPPGGDWSECSTMSRNVEAARPYLGGQRTPRSGSTTAVGTPREWAASTRAQTAADPAPRGRAGNPTTASHRDTAVRNPPR